MKYSFIVFIVLIGLIAQAQKFEGLAPTPPMGWNSWNTFETRIDEQLVKDIADLFVAKGYKGAGYSYIVLDDGWMAKERDSNGNLVADTVKFPNGMKAVADYVHSKGLKFGLYNCAGTKTCAGYPGSKGYEYQDAKLYASWDVDFLKYDWCYTEGVDAKKAYATMRDAIYKSGRPMIFSLCEWGDNKPWLWAKDVGHLWRVAGDITNCFDCEVNHGTWSSWGVMRIVDMHQKDTLRQYAGPDHWNDLDMMEVGNGMTVAEDKSHFSLWCMHATPLIMGNDLRSATDETVAILTNKDAIAINQDTLGIQGYKVYGKDSMEVWVKPLTGNEWAFCFLNRKNVSDTLDWVWRANPVRDMRFNKYIKFDSKVYGIYDLWQHKMIGNTNGPTKQIIAPHGVLFVKLVEVPTLMKPKR